MALRTWFRRRSEPTTRIALPNREEVAGTLEEFTTLDAVFRSLAYLQTVAGQLTLEAHRDSQPRDDLSLIRRPDNSMSQYEWTKANVAALSTNGNAYWRVIRDVKDAVIDLQFLLPSRVGVLMNQYGDRTYTLDGRRVATDSIAHVRYLEIPGRATGLGPIQAGRRGLIGSLNISKYGDTIFADGGVPKGILRTDQTLNREAVDEASKEWDAKQNSGKTAVLTKGLDYKYLGISPADLQWLQSQKFSVTKIARLFGIPPVKLATAVDGGAMTYNNNEQAALDFLRDSLMGYLRPIEATFSDLLPRGTTARFNLDALLRPDTKTRYEAHEIGLRAGFLTVGEVRAMEKLPQKEEPK